MADAHAVEVAVNAALLAERDRLQTQVARMAHRLGLEAHAWAEIAEYAHHDGEPLGISARAIENTARARAASLEEFARILVAPAEPTDPSPESDLEQRRRQGERAGAPR